MRPSASELKTITGQVIKVTANRSKRTFTLIVNGTRYRTYPQSKEEFNDNLHNTGNDWMQFIRATQDYYPVK